MNPCQAYKLVLILLISCSFSMQAQERKDLIQFSGIIVTADSLRPIPYTHIINANLGRGTTADYFGYFSFVARKGDTLLFSAIGFKKSAYVIPDTVDSDRYSMIKVMTADTIMLSETVIFPWPSLEQFKEAFVNMQIPDDELEIARKNLERAEMLERSQYYAMDGAMNYRNYIDQHTSKLYHYGQAPPNNLLNPFAWAQFIKAWREGKFKRRD